MMIRLGHIEYSNCVPVHAGLLEATPPDVVLVRDVPSRLNRALADGTIDAAPCSSIEYARHAGEYLILPGHAIGSHGPVRSILLETTVTPEALGGHVVAVPDASATSVVLLRALLELRLGVRPRLEWFDQGRAEDPIDRGAAAALRIGDVALRRTAPAGRHVIDLGAEWTAWTGLPFVFAVWQVRRDAGAATARRLAELLRASRAWYAHHAVRLAYSHGPRYGLEPGRLLEYWNSLRFELDDAMMDGLLRFYRYAADLREAPVTEALELVPLDPADSGVE
jgi:chorismate dehydratase